MIGDEKDYYERRAEQEIEAAQHSSHPEACRAHYLLAGYYLDMIHNPEAAGEWWGEGVAA